MLLEEARRHQRQVFGRLAGEELGQVHAIVGGTRFFAQYGHFQVLRAGFRQAFQELVTYHAVADDDQFHDAFLVR
ncbi:hypothetical protein D3C72_1938850 [compost metagenome]